jgi:hypothetical protein
MDEFAYIDEFIDDDLDWDTEIQGEVNEDE